MVDLLADDDASVPPVMAELWARAVTKRARDLDSQRAEYDKFVRMADRADPPIDDRDVQLRFYDWWAAQAALLSASAQLQSWCRRMAEDVGAPYEWDETLVDLRNAIEHLSVARFEDAEARPKPVGDRSLRRLKSLLIGSHGRSRLLFGKIDPDVLVARAQRVLGDANDVRWPDPDEDEIADYLADLRSRALDY